MTKAQDEPATVDKTPPPTAIAESSGGVVATLFRFQSVFGLLAVFVAAIIFSPRRDGEILFSVRTTSPTWSVRFRRSGSSRSG